MRTAQQIQKEADKRILVAMPECSTKDLPYLRDTRPYAEMVIKLQCENLVLALREGIEVMNEKVVRAIKKVF